MRTSLISRILYFLSFFASMLYMESHAQITGIVRDAEDQPLPFANVLLLSAADSSLVKGDVTGDDGSYLINSVPSAEYLLMISMIGYQTYYSSPFNITEQKNEKTFEPITLLEDNVQLKEVEVVAKKPLFEQKIDRLVVNVENSITSAGSTALEVLQRSPGIVVDRQNNAISLAGKDGVIVMINGKINRMPISAVVQMLNGMPSSNIEKIELITTPPANFDAEGNAGYINIVLKQTSDQGFNGSYTFAAGYGRGLVASGAVNFNYRKGDFNLYGDYSASTDGKEQVFSFNRMVLLDGDQVGTDTRSERDPIQRNHNARLGMDLNLGERTVLGLLLSGYDNRWSMDALTQTTLSLNGVPDSILRVNLDEINHWQHFGGNLNLQHKLKRGGELIFDADVLLYDNENPSNYYTSYFDPSGNPLFDDQTFSGKITPLEVGVVKLDYLRQLSDNFKIEAGVKGTLSHFINDVTVSYYENDIPVNDPGLTAEYELDESIAAVYVAGEGKLDNKTNFKLGLRYEFISSNLGSVEQKDIVDRQYGNLFPSAFLARTFNDNNSANISYSRRIARPTFNDMAPFVLFLDPYTFFSGNPALQPAISNAVKLDYRYKTAFFSLQYAVEDSAISNFQVEVIEGTNKQTLASTNMKNQKTASLTTAIPIQITKFWSTQNNLIGTWQEVNAYLDGDLVQVRTTNLQFVWIHNFLLPRDFSAEVFVYYQSKALFGTVVALPIRGVNIGVQKKFKDNLGTLRVGIDDIFDSFRFRGESDFPEYNLVSTADIDFSQRTFKLSYSRNFGNAELKGARNRGTGSEEERRRVN